MNRFAARGGGARGRRLHPRSDVASHPNHSALEISSFSSWFACLFTSTWLAGVPAGGAREQDGMIQKDLDHLKLELLV